MGEAAFKTVKESWMTHGSVFSGIGGFDLAAEWMGWENKFNCDFNKFCQKTLKTHWPQSKTYGDIKTTDFRIFRGEIDVLTGGFPCQDASNANQSGGDKGLKGKKTGLFYEMLRVIDEVRPKKAIVAENVANILRINGGRDFTTILAELSRMGYNAEWRVCYAAEKGAPHKRARLYLVAYPSSIRLQKGETFIPYVQKETSPFTWRAFGAAIPIIRGGSWQSKPPIPVVDDGIPSRLVREAIQAAGNAIVPEIALDIFRSIEFYYNK